MLGPRIQIDELAMQLPAEYQHRAAAIARLVGEELANLSVAQSHSIEQFTVPPVSLPAGAGDRQVATAVASAIGAQLATSSGTRS